MIGEQPEIRACSTVGHPSDAGAVCPRCEIPVRPALMPVGRRDRLSAFTQFVLDNQNMVYNLAYRILGDPELAVTATEDTFLRAFPSFSDYRGSSLQLWLIRIAVTRCQELVHRLPHRDSTSCVPPLGDKAHPSITARRSRQPSCDDAQAVLKTIPPDQRVILVLSDVVGLRYQEIADVTGVSVDLVQSRLRQGRDTLRNALVEQGKLLPKLQR